MLKPLIRTLNGWQFELPLALVLGAAVAFATIAMPHSLFGRLPGVTASGFERPIQIAVALLAALLAAVVGYRAMAHSTPRVAGVVEDEEEEAGPPIDIAVRLRRSDAHPDFPPREPIRASRDLGEPFMDVVGFADGPNAARATSPVSAAIPDADYIELPAEAEAASDVVPAAIRVEEPEVTPELPTSPEALTEGTEQAVAESAPEPAEKPEDHPSIAAFTPEPTIEPTARPERGRRESLAEMMERLSDGLERRAGKPVAPPPADMLAEALARPRAARPALRDALNELNRLAGRQG
jgi:hypothetical protein